MTYIHKRLNFGYFLLFGELGDYFQNVADYKGKNKMEFS